MLEPDEADPEGSAIPPPPAPGQEIGFDGTTAPPAMLQAQPAAGVPAALQPPPVGAPPIPAAPQPQSGIEIGIGKIGRANQQAQQAGQASLAATEKAYRDQQDAALRDSAREQENLRFEAPKRAKEAELAGKWEQQSAAANERAATQTDAQISHIRQLETQLASSDAAKGFWANKGIGQTIGWGIALAAGAFAQAASRGRIQTNGAMQIFERALQQDNQDKTRQLAAQRDTVAGERSILGELRQKFGDERTALQANYLLGIGKIQAQIKAFAAGTADERAKAQSDMYVAQLEEKKAQVESQLRQNLGATNLQSAQAQAGLLATQDQLDTHRMIAEMTALQKQRAAEMGITYRPQVPGFAMPAPTEKAYHDLADKMAAYSAVKDQASALADMLAPKVDGKRQPIASWRHLNAQDLGRLDQLTSLLDLTNLEGFHRGAAVSPEEWSIIKSIRGGGATWQALKPATVARLLGNLQDYMKQQGYNYAIATGQMQPGTDPWSEENLAKMAVKGSPEWDAYRATAPTLQKAVKGGN